jgi:serine/threonine-protein kinase HipA
MLISGEDRLSRISSCVAAAHRVAAAHHFLLSRDEALTIVEHQIGSIAEHWDAVCDDAEFLSTRQFLNPFSMEGVAAAQHVRLT